MTKTNHLTTEEQRTQDWKFLIALSMIWGAVMLGLAILSALTHAPSAPLPADTSGSLDGAWQMLGLWRL